MPSTTLGRATPVVPEKLTAGGQVLLDLITESPERFIGALREFIENSADDLGVADGELDGARRARHDHGGKAAEQQASARRHPPRGLRAQPGGGASAAHDPPRAGDGAAAARLLGPGLPAPAWDGRQAGRGGRAAVARDAAEIGPFGALSRSTEKDANNLRQTSCYPDRPE